MSENDENTLIATSPADVAMAHRAVLSTLLALLAKRKVINRPIIERRLQSLVDSGPAAGMSVGVTNEIAFVLELMGSMLDGDEPQH